MSSKWSYTVGEYGYTVTVEERRKGGNLYIRYTGMSGKTRRESLGHKDKTRAEQQARERAATLLQKDPTHHGGDVTLDYVVASYLANVTKNLPDDSRKRGRDKFHADLWLEFLGARHKVEDIDENDIRAFEVARKRGEIRPPGRSPGRGLKDTTIGHGIDWLKAVLNWATRTKVNGKPLLNRSPIRGYETPRTKEPARPVATWDRYVAVRKHAKEQNERFPYFMDILVAQGWRGKAVRILEVRHVNTTRTREAPYGKIYRPPLKQETGAWIPMKERTRAAVEALFSMSQGIGPWPLFPSPILNREDGTPKAWSRAYVYKLYKNSEKAAIKAGDIDGTKKLGALHMYRRMWATTHKHLPTRDVMAYGGWKSEKIFRQSYEQIDSETTLEVVENERKLREGEV